MSLRGNTKNDNLIILDGGLATYLESKGNDLNHRLWSAHILLTNPDSIQQAHLDFLRAGADCIYNVSYQLSYERCLEMGMSVDEVTNLLLLSVELAKNARTQFLAESADTLRKKPLIAASIGPYGAYLADGSEYKGQYDVSKSQLYKFHEKRWRVLADSDIDIMACETIPNFSEIKVLLKLLKGTPTRTAILSLSCKDSVQLADGTPLAKVGQYVNGCDQLLAVGVNCIEPGKVSSILKHLKSSAPNKELLAYPNSGEIYNVESKSWSGQTCHTDISEFAQEWYDIGARWIGGCCRTGPEHIRAIRDVLVTN